MKQKLFLPKIFFVLTVIISFGTVLGMVDYLKKYNPPDFNPPSMIAESSLPSIPKETSKEENLEKKKYISEKYNFEFAYLATWQIYDDDSADIFIQPEEEKSQKLPIPHDGALEIKISALPAKTKLADEIKKAKEDGINFREEKISIGTTEGIKIITELCKGKGCSVFEWFVGKNNYLYHFSTIYPGVAYDSVFDQIISSFTFTP